MINDIQNIFVFQMQQNIWNWNILFQMFWKKLQVDLWCIIVTL
jgi:hypothetical protein